MRVGGSAERWPIDFGAWNALTGDKTAVWNNPAGPTTDWQTMTDALTGKTRPSSLLKNTNPIQDGSAGTPRPTDIQEISQGRAKPPAEPGVFQQAARVVTPWDGLAVKGVAPFADGALRGRIFTLHIVDPRVSWPNVSLEPTAPAPPAQHIGDVSSHCITPSRLLPSTRMCNVK